MPNLTGKELADLYPKAKSYDELRADSERIQQLRRLRFVPAKVALWTTLGTAVALVAGYLIPGILSGLSDDAMQVLTSVSFSGIVAVAALAIVFYLRSLIDDLASKIILSMSLLYTALGTIICITGGIFAFFVQYMGVRQRLCRLASAAADLLCGVRRGTIHCRLPIAPAVPDDAYTLIFRVIML